MLNQTLANFGATLSNSTAAIVTLIGALLAWSIVVAVIAALWWIAFRTWGKQQKPQADART